MGNVFNHLRFYHRARSFDSEALHSRGQWRPYNPEKDPPDSLMRSVYEWVPLDGKTTWRDEANSCSNADRGVVGESQVLAAQRVPGRRGSAGDARPPVLWKIPSENLVKIDSIVNLPDGDFGWIFV